MLWQPAVTETFAEEAKVWSEICQVGSRSTGTRIPERELRSPLSRYFRRPADHGGDGALSYEAYFEMFRMKNWIAGSFRMPSRLCARRSSNKCDGNLAGLLADRHRGGDGTTGFGLHAADVGDSWSVHDGAARLGEVLRNRDHPAGSFCCACR